jgi:hypothetical protein
MYSVRNFYEVGLLKSENVTGEEYLDSVEAGYQVKQISEGV